MLQRFFTGRQKEQPKVSVHHQTSALVGMHQTITNHIYFGEHFRHLFFSGRQKEQPVDAPVGMYQSIIHHQTCEHF